MYYSSPRGTEKCLQPHRGEVKSRFQAGKGLIPRLGSWVIQLKFRLLPGPRGHPSATQISNRPLQRTAKTIV
jgi:hypothetical protein